MGASCLDLLALVTTFDLIYFEVDHVLVNCSESAKGVARFSVKDTKPDKVEVAEDNSRSPGQAIGKLLEELASDCGIRCKEVGEY